MDLNQLKALVAVIGAGSLHQAAKHCSVSRSTLRVRLDALEAAVGRPLLVRTHRGVLPTEFGQRYLEQAQRVLDETEMLASLAANDAKHPQGTLRIKSEVGTLVKPVSLFVAMVQARYPDLRIHLSLQEDPIRSLTQDVDLILFFGRTLPVGPYSTVTLGEFPIQAVASRDYLERRGRPLNVADLSQHTLLTWRQSGDEDTGWPLVSGGSIGVDSLFCTNSHLHLRVLAVDGLGIALLPNPDLASLNPMWNTLEVVLPDQIGRMEYLTALIPEARRHSPKKVVWLSLIQELKDAVRSTVRK